MLAHNLGNFLRRLALPGSVQQRLLVCMFRGGSSCEFIGGKLISAHPELDYYEKSAYGLWRDQRVKVEGHTHIPEMDMVVVYRCDDEG